MSERQMTILLLVLMGLIIVAGAGGLYYLQLVWLAELEEQLAVVRKDVEIAQKKKADIPMLEAKKKVLLESIERIRSQIPVFSPKEENDQFADLVGDTIRKKTRVDITTARFTPARSGGPGDAIPPTIFRARYEFKVSGGFYQMLNFLNHLETERRFLVADSIKLSAGNAPDKPGKAQLHDMTMYLSTFLQRPSGPPPVPPPKPGEQPPPTEPQPEETRRLSTPIPD